MSHKILRPFIVKVSVLGYFPGEVFPNNPYQPFVYRHICHAEPSVF